MNKKAYNEILQSIITITQQKAKIQKIAKENIPDFHFLDYAVSNFWECKDSPIGWCVFKLDDNFHKTECRYCNGPVERK